MADENAPERTPRKRLSRREALALGAGAAAAVAVGGGLLVWSLRPQDASPPPTADPSTAGPGSTGAPRNGTLREPDVLASSNGLLSLTLTAGLSQVEVAGRKVRAFTFNGGVPGPTWRVRRGDKIRVSLRNDLGAPTNLHTHGLVVSPEGKSDNVFIMLSPGQQFDYEYTIAADHPPGLFWYHPHHHGNTAEQLFGGLYGAIVVDDDEPLEAVRERVLIISDISFQGETVRAATTAERSLGREGDVVMVNGQTGAEVTVAPGERERWRIVNACSSRYLRLRLDGQIMQLLGIDAGRYAQPLDVDEIVLTPGNRADLMVTAVQGTSVLRTLPFDRGTMGMLGRPPSATTGADLLTVRATGTPVSSGTYTVPQPTTHDLRPATMTRRRTITLAMGPGGGGPGAGGGMRFTIDGKEFAEERTDIVIEPGALEEWTLVNTSPMDHPFHLHVWPMQLIQVGGQPVSGVDWRDVVPVPAGSSTIVRIAFTGLTGRTVYHCHILDHEDLGMMGTIRVG